jgi:hypothetical protein
MKELLNYKNILRNKMLFIVDKLFQKDLVD